MKGDWSADYRLFSKTNWNEDDLFSTILGSCVTANSCFLKDIPERTTVVARIRKNARLRTVLPKENRTGNRKYGAHLANPEEMLADPDIPTREMTIAIGGRTHTIRHKVVDNVCWSYEIRKASFPDRGCYRAIGIGIDFLFLRTIPKAIPIPANQGILKDYEIRHPR